MKILVYGAGVLGSLHAARLHDAGHDVALLARGSRLAALKEHGIRLAEGDSESAPIRAVPVPIVDTPAGDYDLTAVFVRTHQVDEVVASLAGQRGDVLFLLNWAGGFEPLTAALGRGRVLLGFPNSGGTMDGDVVRYRPDSRATRLVRMPIGEPDGRTTPRLERVVAAFRSAGINAKPEARMDAWLKTHAAFEVPLGQAVHAAGGLEALAGDPAALRVMVQRIRQSLTDLPMRPVPRAFGVLRIAPERMLVGVFRRFLRNPVAAPLATDSPAVTDELDALTEQLRTLAKAGSPTSVAPPRGR